MLQEISPQKEYILPDAIPIKLKKAWKMNLQCYKVVPETSSYLWERGVTGKGQEEQNFWKVLIMFYFLIWVLLYTMCSSCENSKTYDLYTLP